MKRSLIIAHRGYHRKERENSIAAFEAASKMGADGIELDIRRSRDNQIIVHHDPYIIQKNKKIYLKKYSLKKLNEISSHPISTLEEVLKKFGNQFKIINIEIKSTKIKNNGIENQVYELIKKMKIKAKIRISSFNPFVLMNLRRLDPKLELGYLISPQNWYTQMAWAQIFLRKNFFIHLDSRFIDFKQHHHITNWKTPLWIWTVNDPFEIDWCKKNPFIDGIITDNLPHALKV